MKIGGTSRDVRMEMANDMRRDIGGANRKSRRF